MNPETSTPELNKALVAAQAEMPAVPFDSKNPFLGNRYASLGSVIATSRPVLAKNGLAIEQKPYSREGRIGVKTVMRHVSGECSESELDMPMTGEKGKSAIQEAGSIITYIRRYAWSAVCGLYADEDTDGNGAETSGKAVSSPVKPKTAPSPPQSVKTPPVTSQTKRTPKEQEEHTKRLETWLGQCKASLLDKLEPVLRGASEYAAKAGMILPNEVIHDATLGKLFPSVDWNLTTDQNQSAVKKDFDALMAAVQKFMDGDPLGDQIPGAEVPPADYRPHPMVPHPDPDPEGTARTARIEVPRDEHLDPNSPDAEWFWDLIIPVPRRGEKRDFYLKNPDTIRNLYEKRHGTDEASQIARERLFGFVNRYEPKGWEKRDGTKMPPSDSDIKFKEALVAFGVWLVEKGEKL